MCICCLVLSKPAHQEFKNGDFSHLDSAHGPYLL